MVRYAEKTMQAIEQVMMADQGNSYRANLREALLEASDIYKQEEDQYRTHLGASVIGRECARQVWYMHRWCKPEQFSGRMLRLFNRGNIEEARCVALLRTIGCQVSVNDANDRQFKFSALNQLFGGSLDGIVYGLPDLPDEHLLSEFKTHNENSFIKLQQDGVEKAKPEHYAQMICYLHAYRLSYAIYIGVNKDDDDLHMEIVEANPVAAERYVERARLILDNVPPPRISNTPGFWKCKFCPVRGVCFQGEPVNHTCRSCEHVRVSAVEGTEPWSCIKFHQSISTAVQKSGCVQWKENECIRAK